MWNVSSAVLIGNLMRAVRLLKGAAFPDNAQQVDDPKHVAISVVALKGWRWDDLFLRGAHVPEDFLVERQQPAAEVRDPL